MAEGQEPAAPEQPQAPGPGQGGRGDQPRPGDPKTAQGFINEDGRLHTWCKEGKKKKVEEFIRTCKDLPLRLAYRRGVFGYTPLHEAVSNGHSEILKVLLRHDGDVNSRANSGYTPLHLAASSGHVDCVRVLLDNAADIANTDEYGKTPIQTAELSSKHGVVKVLRSAGEYAYMFFTFTVIKSHIYNINAVQMSIT